MISAVQKYRSALCLAGLGLALGMGVWVFQEELAPLVRFLENDRAHPLLVILAFLILPLFFFPVSALLILLGLRFDMLSGILIMFILMPVHLAVSFFAARSVLGRHAEKLARNKHYQRFQVPQDRLLEFGFIFMAIPGMPYSVKNYLLPLSGIRFREYFFISWLVQGVMGIPFVVLGEAASQWSYHLLTGFLVLFVVFFVIGRKLRKRYDTLVQSGGNKCG